MERQQREAAEAALRAEEVSVHACLPACTCVGDRQCMCVPNGLPRACTCARCKRDVMMADRAHMSPNKTTLAAVSCRPHSLESSRVLTVPASMLPLSLGQEKKQEAPTTIKTFASIVEGVVTAKKVPPWLPVCASTLSVFERERWFVL